MEISYQLSREDMNFAHDTAHFLNGQLLAKKGAGFFSNLLIWTCLSVAFLSTFRGLSSDPSWQHSNLAVVALCLALAGVIRAITGWRDRRTFRAAQLELFAPYPVCQKLVAGDSGLIFEGRWGRCETPWRAVQAVRDSPKHLIIVLRPCQVCVIPKQAIGTAEQCNDALAYLDLKVRSSREPTGVQAAARQSPLR
ncbi:MAG: YcxB family protein [Rhodanobacteraceae bacterium]|nr:YcxB family protein [Rhodanobacteraceae bacterium]